jgi:alpha-1,6-mannosyltransferase
MTARLVTRTLHLTNAWHESSGGVRTFYLALLAEAERRGRTMTVVVPGEEDRTTRLGQTTRVVSLRAPRVPFLDRRYRAIWPHRFATSARTRLWRVIQEARPDVVEVSDKYSLCHVAGLLKRRPQSRPTVVGLSQERMDDALAAHVTGRPVAAAIASHYVRKVYLRQFDAHIANSEYTAAELRAAATLGGPATPLLWRLRNRIYVQPLGCDLNGFTPAARSESLRADLLARAGRPASSRLAVFAGRLSAEKAVDALVPALARCRAHGLDTVLAIAGDGPLASAMWEEARRCVPGRVVMLGHMGGRRELARLLASADVFVHPNPREPFGIGPLEAMASGTPVVVPASGGVLTYATTENACLAEPGAEGLARAWLACEADPREATRRTGRARQDVQKFSWPSAATRYFEAYDLIHELRTTEWTRHLSAADRVPVDALVDVPHREH